MSERQAENNMDRDTKLEIGSGQSWIYSSLTQTIRPIATLASRLGVLPYSYNAVYDRNFVDPHYNEQENKKLIDVWGKAENARIGFVSLHIFSQKDNETKLSQIGMSKWRSGGLTQTVSVHCQIEHGTPVSESSSPRLIAGDFIFGDTEVITESDVGPWLDATFKSFQFDQDISCLVGHDIRHILHLVKSDWEVPGDVVILDTRAIWESQAKATQHPSFDRTLRRVGHDRDGSVLNNAGNNARFVLELLKEEGFQASKTACPQEYAFGRSREHRRALQHGQITPASWSSM